MKRILFLVYLFFCITFSVQAGVKDRILRVCTGKPSAIAPQAPRLVMQPAIQTATNAASCAIAGSMATTLPPIGNVETPRLPNTGFSSLQLYQILKNRVNATYQAAVQLQEDLPNRGLMGEPVKFKGLSLYPMKAKEIYPDKPFLHKGLLSPVLTQLYYLAQSNRLYIQHLKQSQDFWPAFNEAIPRFYQEAQATPQPNETELVAWAAAQIPANIKVLGIGELHGYRELPAFLADLLEKIDDQMVEQGRKVILFTEFLTNPNTPGHLLGGLVACPYGHYYTAVWNRARHLDIEVVGLEDKYVRSDLSMVQAYAGNGNTVPLQQWATMSGIQMRNEHWSNILKKYREQNPDALFIIYAGSGHLLYNYPFSLLAPFNKEETFMLNLTPDEAYEEGRLYYDTDPLEELNPNLSFPQPVIKWQSADLVQLSGYDARVRLPVDIQAKRQDLVHWGLDDWSIAPRQ